MINILFPLLTSFLSAVLVTLIGLPLIVKTCRYFNFFDLPDGRKVHSRPVPRLGGLIFMPAAVVGLFVASWTQVMMGGEEFVFGVSTSIVIHNIFTCFTFRKTKCFFNVCTNNTWCKCTCKLDCSIACFTI